MIKYNLNHEKPTEKYTTGQRNINEKSQQEISNRIKTEGTLREMEEKYRNLVERTNDGIAIIQDRLIKYVNPRLAEISGYMVEELIGSPFAIYIHPDELPKVVNCYLRHLACEEVPSKYESVVKHKEGCNIFVEFNACIITYHGKPANLVIVRDITERKQAEEEKERLQKQLIQLEKMARIGILTSGVAHEFNNLLQIMREHTEFAQRTKKAEDMEEALDIVINTSDRVNKIFRDLLAFSKKEAAEKKLCDITEPIESVLSMTEEQLKKNNIEVMRKYGKVPKIEVNRAEIQQVFLNMVTNARDSMLPKGGKLEIEVKQVKENVEVRFTDTGEGIEKEDLGKVFEPFYTTKGAVGGNSRIQGVGLGLSVSYGIAEKHGGMIEVESEAGKGTTFTVKLPGKGEEVKKEEPELERRNRAKNQNI